MISHIFTLLTVRSFDNVSLSLIAHDLTVLVIVTVIRFHWMRRFILSAYFHVGPPLISVVIASVRATSIQTEHAE